MDVTPSFDLKTFDEQLRHLERLAGRLRPEGWHVHLLASDRKINLRVINPAAVALNDDIKTEPDGSGVWWFHWSFETSIAQVDDLELAAARIACVLGTRSAE